MALSRSATSSSKSRCAFVFLLGLLASQGRVSGGDEPATQRSAKSSSGTARSLTLNQATHSQLSQQSVEYFELAIPSGVEAVSVHLTDRSEPSACGAGSEDIKAFVSLRNPKPSIWNHTWVLNMCSESEVAIADLPLGQDRRLFVAVFSAVRAEFSIVVSGIEPSLSTGITLRHRRHCEPTSNVNEQQRFEAKVFEFAIPIPAEVQAVSLDGHADSSLATPVSVFVSTTVSNMTKLPYTWAHANNLTLSRGDPGFCKVEPCVLYVQLRSPEFQATCGCAGEYACSSYHHPVSTVYSLTVRATHPIPRLQLSPRTALRGPSCAPGCLVDFVDDGICDEACFTPGCAFDGEDCDHDQRYAYCAPGCKSTLMLGDGVCDDACYSKSCHWDKGDCFRYLREIRMNRAFAEEKADTIHEEEKEAPAEEQTQEDLASVELAA